MEWRIVCKQKASLNEYVEDVIQSPFLFHTYFGCLVVHLLIDGYTLYCLNCLHPSLGVTHPPHLRGKPVLLVSEEKAVIFRHLFKLLVRTAPVGE